MFLDREGIFKAVPASWGIQKSRDSQSVAVVIEFRIVAKLDGDEWEDWTGYTEQTITGYFYIVKRDGGVNSITVESLAESLGWNGELITILSDPPRVVCQITVQNEEWQGKTRLKVNWLNPENFVPGLQTETPEEVRTIESVYGSRLKACAGQALKDKPKPEAPPEVEQTDEQKKKEEDLPF